ncbi:Isoquinoline 1-oxidoreductase subunit beta [Sulfitobacter indolifex]|uniref:Probable oxidoreductase n=1 Tax=Sulfitobacter indolifex HEL-45 TaxID=391624 RepID=A0ABP2DAN6_9RHOB|nr:xanthine dehydrogenase family protein molybdopterin-binding subunit [Sulfitobacter indolifex]EDQ05041.1 Probable oxidoreductase [Sulfitobacter indolifex HEL-45]UOA18091.1 Isoquinoline 1-oxidoreductase subunit beta [Sulfitobacter indolifex]
MTITQSRRNFLATSLGLVIAVALPMRGRAQSGAALAFQPDGTEPTFAPNAFIRVAEDDTVTVIIKHIEFGQGPFTGLSTLVAEEMDADWSQMRAESAPADDDKYKNLLFGLQATGGSTAMANSYTQMRKAGAAARAMLVQAAAEDWGVDASTITISGGVLTSGDKSSTFGPLAAKAAMLTPPEDPPVKDPKDFVLIGKDRPKLDSQAKSTGSAVFTMDMDLPGMEYVVIRHAPMLGGAVASFDDADALKVPGVTAVRQIPQGIAVYATSTHAALSGRNALTVEWDDSAAETRTSTQMMEDFAALANSGEARAAEEVGDVDASLSESQNVVEMEFRFPYLAHAPMEPLDAVIQVKEGSAETWGGYQFPGFDRQAVAGTLGLPVENVKLNVMLAGGSFGRRAQPSAQIGNEISAIAKAAGRDGAWKLIWTREDDLAGGYYRPMTVHKMRGAVDTDGNIVGWHDVIVNQSIMAGGPMEQMMKDGKDPTSYEGAVKMPYDLANLRVDWVRAESAVPVLWWRSVGHSHTGYATEVFLDHLLEAGGKDPLQGRLDLLKGDMGRDRAVLEKVAEMADWDGTKVKGDKGYGVALHESFGTYVAQIAEVEDRDGFPHVTKVWCAVDCGVAVNPNVIRAQIEGGIGYGLGTVLFNAVTLGEGGIVQEQNFDTYRMLRINEMPAVEVEIIESALDPTGIGEPGTPPVGPAVANAWRALTGTNVTTLPFLSANGA